MAELLDLLSRSKKAGLMVAALASVPLGLLIDWIAWKRLGDRAR